MFAFNFKLCRYTMDDALIIAENAGTTAVGRCRLILSKSELKAHLVSAFETTM
jgi:hypothetical protein